MNFDAKTLAYIQNVIKTAQLVKLDNVIIESGDTPKVRAIDDNKTVVLFHDQNIPTLPFEALGLNRLSTFIDRYDLAKTSEGFTVVGEASAPDAKEGTVFVRSLLMKGKGIKIEYRCANPSTIQAPRVLNDTAKFKIKMTPEAVLTMQKGQSAMDADIVTFVYDKDGVSLQIEDVNKDVLEYTFTNDVETLGSKGAESNFKYKYSLKTIVPLFKQMADGYFFITNKGMLKLTVNGLDLYIIPRI